MSESTGKSEVMALVERREHARAHRNWAAADALRMRIAALGWQVNDNVDGPHLEPIRGEVA